MLTAPEKPLIAIVGGAKVSDKIKLIDALIDRADGLIICGGMAYTFLKVCFGMQIGKSLFDKNGAEIVQSILDKAKVSCPPASLCTLAISLNPPCLATPEARPRVSFLPAERRP